MTLREHFNKIAKNNNICVNIPKDLPYLHWQVRYKPKGRGQEVTTTYIDYSEKDDVDDEYIVQLKRTGLIEGRIISVELVDNKLDEVDDPDDWKETTAKELFRKQVLQLQKRINTYLKIIVA
jgi:hypothetical protein